RITGCWLCCKFCEEKDTSEIESRNSLGRDVPYAGVCLSFKLCRGVFRRNRSAKETGREPGARQDAHLNCWHDLQRVCEDTANGVDENSRHLVGRSQLRDQGGKGRCAARKRSIGR